MKKFGSSLFTKFGDLKIVNESLSKINGGRNTMNDCTGTGGDCWDANGGTSVVEDMTPTGGYGNGDDCKPSIPRK